MLITDALLGEHSVFYLLFQNIEQALPTFDSITALQIHLAPLSFALEAHARLEDELLFTALEIHLGTQAGPLVVMRMEHDQIVNLLAGIQSASGLAQGRDLASQMTEVARGHFQKEEQALFRMARQLLGENTLYALGVKWAQQRGLLAALDIP